ncbi:hypothetical protein GH741_07910 [Aquibacillus halophilus]|uniref:Uncharacterized protein n=1 Tax=Aquibacillus halophilus TaxID=930132 RepID=A0A6A8DAH8_9BACI|nr:hypothetical protein [Aquibacillus halophilus]MRH42608.1 hypothetical protein [Aquibacillus halophilus]
MGLANRDNSIDTNFVSNSIGNNEYGSELSHLSNEFNETYMQIDNALESASESQSNQLFEYKQTIGKIIEKINKNQN